MFSKVTARWLASSASSPPPRCSRPRRPVAGPAQGGGGDGVTVVATTTQAADLARQVAGDRARVVGLLPPGADPHDHEVRPDDVKALADAALVVRSGGELDAWLDGRRRELRHERADADADGPRPHAGAATRTGGRTRATRSAPSAPCAPRSSAPIPPARSATPPARAPRPGGSRRSTRAAAACLARLPAADRKLVTTHDSLGYYADRYDLEVVGAVIPSLSTQAQPSAGDTAALVDLIRRERVKAIFAESSVSAKVEEAIARETGAAVGRPLWADSLGPAESDGATYAGSIAANTRAIAEGLSGGALSCRLPA